MIVRCLHTSFGSMEDHPELARFRGTELESFSNRDVPLRVGMDYLVAAISFGPSLPWYFVFDRCGGLLTPILAPCLLFEVRDSRCSRTWLTGTWIDRFDRHHGLLAPACWAYDSMFHGKLFEGEDLAMQQMAAAKSEMILEFPLPWIEENAIAVGSGNFVADQD